VAALCCLARADAAQLSMIKAGCLATLLIQIRHVHSRLRQQCALAVYQLTCTALQVTPKAVGGPQQLRLSDAAATQASQQTAPAAAAAADSAAAAAADAAALYGLGRLRILMEADVASALTIGSLFRADDNVTRDLCAATLFNLVALTHVAPDESDRSAEDSKEQDDDEKSSQPTSHSRLALRQKLLADGVLWAVVKLTQGFSDASAAVAGDLRSLASGRFGSRGGDAVTLAVLHSRHVTTVRFLRNMASAPASAEEAAKKHAIDSLLWYAHQTCLHYRSIVDGTTALSGESNAGLALSLISEAGALRLHPAIIPAVAGYVSQAAYALTGHVGLRHALVMRGLPAVIKHLAELAALLLQVRVGGG
jgi:hypothetical protein